jgi:3-oxoadipate enol-lactonase
LSLVDENEIRTAKIGDVDVVYREHGSGPRIVFIHGLGQDKGIWATVQDQLADYTTMAYDLRGHGASSLGNADGTIAQLGLDLIHFLEHVGPAICVGFSLGGSVALWAAAERPELFVGVIAVATSSVVGSAAAKAMEERIVLFEEGDPEVMRAILFEDTVAQLADSAFDAGPITTTRIKAIGDARGYLNAALAVRGMHGDSLNPRLDRIQNPVLIVSGERDVWCPRKAAEIMLEHLGNAAFEELAGVGHLVTDVAPERLVAVMRWWMKDKEKAS